MNTPGGPPKAPGRERRHSAAEDDTQTMTDAHDDSPEAWARKVAACEDQGLD